MLKNIFNITTQQVTQLMKNSIPKVVSTNYFKI